MATISELQRGTDSSGRLILDTDRAWAAWQAVLAHPRVQPFASLVTVVQGAFMSLLGGGAEASAGYHDLAGCKDVRTWNLTDAQEAILWDVASLYGIHFWKRDAAHGGMDEHGHGLTLWDGPLASGAAYQRSQAIARKDGLAGGGPDYMHTPHRYPLVLAYPKTLIAGDDMADPKTQQTLADIKQGIEDVKSAVEAGTSADTRRWLAEKAQFQRDQQRQSRRYQALVAKIGGLADELEGDARKKALVVLASAEDVTGADAPAPGKA